MMTIIHKAKDKKNCVEMLYSSSVQFSRSVMSNSFAVPWTVACQAPLSMGFPRQELPGNIYIFLYTLLSDTTIYVVIYVYM